MGKDLPLMRLLYASDRKLSHCTSADKILEKAIPSKFRKIFGKEQKFTCDLQLERDVAFPPSPNNNNNNNTISILFCFFFREMSGKETYNNLHSALWDEQLDLESIDDGKDDPVSNMEEVLQIILIVVSVVLGTLVIVLFAAFFIRTRRWVLHSAIYIYTVHVGF